MRSMIKAWVPVAVMCGLGSVAALAGCQFPVPADVCVASEATCADGMLTVCGADGKPGTPTACTFGCAPGGAGRCADLAPSNGLGMYLDQARAAAPLVLTGDAVVDTDTGKVTVNGQVVAAQTAIVPAAPVEILVIIARSFEANNVIARGRRALAIVSDGDVVLNGTLSVSASREVAGAGASGVADPLCGARAGAFNLMGRGGAGGGGFGSPGGGGGKGSTASGGMGGDVLGNESLVPLRGGCPGAFMFAVPNSNPDDAHAGAAGGAVQISTRGAIVLKQGAGVTASGGGAKGNTAGPFCGTCGDQQGQPPSCEQGSGGGAGGGILLEAGAVIAPASTAVVANGGAGTCGFCSLAPDGATSESQAEGPNCSAFANVGNGGNGGAGSVAGFNGGDGSRFGGGGGGGAGRIRINLPPQVIFDPGPPIVSPTPSIGALSIR